MRKNLMKENDLIGKTFNTNNYGKLIVIGYENNRSVEVKFIDTGYITKTELVQIKKGTVKDRLKPSVYNVGILGDSSTFDENGKKLKTCELWYNVLQRCYDHRYMEIRPTYSDCEVSEYFKFYPNFKNWCENQIGFDKKNWHLDKDVLIKGNKVYSPETCCFVPQEINVLFTKRQSLRGKCPIGVHLNGNKFVASLCKFGEKRNHLGRFNTEKEAFLVYKEAKELHIKEVANKYKGQIDDKVYQALMSYEVEITD